MLSTNDNSSSPDKSQTPTQTQPEDAHSLTPDNNPHPNKEDEASSSSELFKVDTSDVLAKGVSSIIGTVMKDFDFKADNAVKSQDQLSSAIDRLTGELDQLLEDAPVPFLMQHAAKISGVRKRVSSLNSLLKSIQRRIDNIDWMLSTGSAHEKPMAELDRKNQH